MEDRREGKEDRNKIGRKWKGEKKSKIFFDNRSCSRSKVYWGTVREDGRVGRVSGKEKSSKDIMISLSMTCSANITAKPMKMRGALTWMKEGGGEEYKTRAGDHFWWCGSPMSQKVSKTTLRLNRKRKRRRQKAKDISKKREREERRSEKIEYRKLLSN